VPASLFMVISMTLLRNHAASSGSPKEILTYVNHQLCQNNKQLMFCTVWLGILDLRTGRLIAANAGHEYPAIRRNGEEYALLSDQHDPPLGLRDGLRYREYELTLSPGDCLFQYTDGVTEATDAALELFGEERMTQALNAADCDAPKTTICHMQAAIDGFVKEAVQFDDITMLCLRYNGCLSQDEDVYRTTLTVPAKTDRLDEVMGFFESELEKVDCPMEDLYNLTLVAEELFVNIAHYAYDGREGEARIDFSFDRDQRMVEVTFSDSGIPFDPTLRPAPDITKKPGQRPIGGLGIHLVRKLMDDVRYEYQGGKNRLTVKKKI